MSLYNGQKLALDCEMVADFHGSRMLARVSIVDKDLNVIYDTLVKPKRAVHDYLTQYSGIKKGDLDNAPDFSIVKGKVADIINGATLVGHTIHYDLTALEITHSKQAIIDIRDFPRFRQDSNGRCAGLKLLARRYLGVSIQDGTHDSIEDAVTTMKIYNQFIKNSSNPGPFPAYIRQRHFAYDYDDLTFDYDDYGDY